MMENEYLWVCTKFMRLQSTYPSIPANHTKGGFYSERAEAFVISPNRRTQLFS